MDNKETKNVQEPSKEKKISFISAMLIVIGGSVGAGIFFKSDKILGYSHSSLILAIFCWIIAACAVIAMGLALIELTSVKNDNLSLMSWCKVFNSKRIYRASKDFMTYIYLPLTYLFMPFYVILSLQDGLSALTGNAKFGTNFDWIIWLIIGLGMSAYFLIVPAYWSKVGNIQNIVVLAIKFIPLVAVVILGFVLAATGKGGTADINWTIPKSTKTISQIIKEGGSVKAFAGFGAGLGVFISIAAIFFAYDGFYVAAGIQSEMKEPKKTPLAIFLGLGITTIIYLIIAIAMSINGGSFSKMLDFMKSLMGEKAANITFGIINICIAIGVLGILNGFSMWAPRFVEDLLAQGDLPFWEKLQGKLNANKPIVGIIYSLVLTIPIVIIFTTIGALAYLDTVGYGDNVYGSGMGRLYSFCDLMADWTAVFTFGFIAVAILGAIINRKTKKVEIKDKKKYFLPAAWISVILVFIGIIVTVLVPVIDLFLLFGIDNNILTGDAKKSLILSRVMVIVVLGIYAGLSFLPAVFEDIVHKAKFGSLEKYEEYKANKLIKKES